MNMSEKNDKCPTCGGNKGPGLTTFTVDLGSSIIVIREVPATVCTQCGDEWIQDNVASNIEAIVEEAKKKRLFVEIAYYNAA